MPPTVAQLNSKVIVDGVQEAIKGLNQVASAFQGAGAGAKQAKSPVDDIVAALAKFGVIKTAVSGLIDLGKATVQNYSDNERLGSSLQALTAKEDIAAGRAANMTQALAGASGKSQELLQWTQQLAIDSPFSQEGVAQAFKMAQAYGFVSETASKTDVDAKRLTQTMIDFASGTGQSEETMSRIALALGQVQAKGKLAGGEMLQLTEAGLNVRQILSDSFHKSTAEIVAMQEKGLIPADKAIKAIVESLERDFGGAAKRQAGTWAGLLNSIDDIKNVGLREFFTGTFQAVQPLLNQFVDTVSKPEVLANIRGWGEGLGQFAKTGATALQSAVANIQALTPLIVGVGVAWAGYQIAQNAATFATAASAATTLFTSAAESARLIVIIAQTEGLQAATVAAWANVGANAKLALTLGAVALAAAAVTAAYLKYREVQAQIAQGVQDTGAQTRGWNESKEALDGYTKLSPAVQGATKGQADSLAQLRAEQEKAIDAYARTMIAGKSLRETEEQWQTRTQAMRDAINQRSTALQQGTVALQSAIAYEDLESNRLAEQNRLRLASTNIAGQFIDKMTQLVGVTKDSADKSLLDTKAKEAAKAQTDLLQQKTKMAAEAYMALNPNITQAGVASAFAAKKIDDSIATYITMILKINAAKSELAGLQKQAGVTPAQAATNTMAGQFGGDVSRYMTTGQTADAEAGKAAVERLKVLKQQEDALTASKRNAIMTNGTAAEKQRVLNKEYDDAARIYGKNSRQAIDAKTALDSYAASQVKSGTTAASQAAKAELDLMLAQQSDAMGKLQLKHDFLVQHLNSVKKNSTDYKETLAQILDLENQITDAKEKQVSAALDLEDAGLKNEDAKIAEARELAGLNRVINGAGFSGEQKAAATRKMREIQIGAQKREISIAAQTKAQGGTPAPGAATPASTDAPEASTPASASPQAATPATTAGAANPTPRSYTPITVQPFAASAGGGATQVTVNLTMSFDAAGRPVVTASDPNIALNMLYDSTRQIMGAGTH